MHVVPQAAAAVMLAGPSVPLDMLRDGLDDALLHSARLCDVTLLAARRACSEEPTERS